ncbi:MAG: hypothetical protein J1F35_04875 [Erysipelotrichales bacterium]|nr:hypothetical protein [Erysipelotrichales bacterium]
MSIGNYFKKRINIFIISAILIIIALVFTFVVLTKNTYQDVLINNKNIQVIFENGKNGIKFGEAPMGFDEGLTKSPNNKYKIVNKSKNKVNYQVIVNEIYQESDTLSKNKVAVCVNDTDCKTLEKAIDGIIYTSAVEPKYQDIINIKFWVLKDNLELGDMDKSILLNVDIIEIEK